MTYSADPINIASGNVFYAATDYESTGPNKLTFTRYYNSRDVANQAIGNNWHSNYEGLLVSNGASQLLVTRTSGQVLTYNLAGGLWATDTDTDLRLVKVSSSVYTTTDNEDTVESYSATTGILMSIKKRNGYTQTLTYNTAGRLSTVVDSYGRTLTFTYNSSNTLLLSVQTPDSTIDYGYTAIPAGSNLTSVTYPTSPSTALTYVYENTTYPSLLTGVVDEDSNRYLTWTYDTSQRGLTSQEGTGTNAQITTIAYNDTTGARTVTNPLGVTDTYSFTTLQNVPKVTGISRAATATTAAATRSFTYDTNGYMASMTDWNGNETTYVNNSLGLPTTINEAVGSSPSVARTTTIAYDTTWARLPATITTPGLTASLTYDTNGNPLTQTLTDTTTTTIPYSTSGQTRTTTYTWGSNFLLASEQSPRTDVTATTYLGYDSSGALTSVTDALGHITSITSHTGGGLPLTVVDPNSVTLTLTYDGRQRPLTSAVSTTGGSRTTSWAYSNNGEVLTTLPDSSTHQTLLDNAHRYIGLTNNVGEQENLTLDVNGDPTATVLLNTGGNTFSRTASFDALGRKLHDTSAVTGQSYTNTFDGDGNTLTTTDPLSHTATRVFDALNRLYKVTDANAGITQLTFDAHDRPLTVSDPISNTTTYVYNGFGDVIQEASPDRGTIVYHYDNNANLTQKVDAASITVNHNYDKLDRVLTTTYPADTAENVAFTYDQTGTGYGKGIGRLTSTTDAAGSLTRSFDERGNMLTEVRTNGTTSYPTTYTYDTASRVASITYPSGSIVTYGRDSVGRVSSVTTQAPGHTSVTLATGITYKPFGAVTAITAFNSDSEAFTLDLDYRMTSLITTAANGPQHQAFTYDNVNNLTGITDTVCTSCSATLGYDSINRLTSAASWYGSYAYTLDKNGNFLTNNENGYAGTYSYTAGTNQISSISVSGTAYPVTYNANGNMTAFTRIPGEATTLTYNNANELSASTMTTGTAASYGYDGFRRRFSKTDSGYTPTLYFYDQTGNTTEEIDGGTSYDYVWLDGRLIGTLTPSTNTLAFVHGDKLGSPNDVTDSSALVANEYSYTPYANTSTPYSQSGAATVTQNNRYPGQFFDPETLMNHNGYRDFSPSLGRYPEVDPSGLNGGTNPYAYAEGNPLIYTDETGLNTFRVNRPLGEVGKIIGNGGSLSYNPFTHTFIVITNPNGSIKSTYSWGNSANLEGWNLDDPLDIEAGRNALDNGNAVLVGDSTLDPFVKESFDYYNDPKFEHYNLVIGENCKSEAQKLLDRAQLLLQLYKSTEQFRRQILPSQ